MRFLCECAGFCRQTIELPTSEYQKINNKGLTLIIDNCLVNLLPGNVLVERKEGYKLYRETTSQPATL